MSARVRRGVSSEQHYLDDDDGSDAAGAYGENYYGGDATTDAYADERGDEDDAPLIEHRSGGGGGSGGAAGGGSYSRVLLNFAKGTIGAGILSMPKAFAQTGVVLGSVTYAVVGLLALYTMLLLLGVKNRVARRQPNDIEPWTFARVAEAVFGAPGRITLEILVVTLQLTISSAYLYLIGNIVHTLYPAKVHHVEVILILFPILVVLSFVKRFQNLWIVSAFGLAVYIFGVAGVTVVQGGMSIHAHKNPHPALATFNMGLFSLAANAMYSIEGINLVLPCENALQVKTRTTSLISVGTLVILAFYIFFSAFSYVAGFGACDVSIECLPAGTTHTTVSLLLCFALLFTHPVQLFPAIELVEARIGPGNMRRQILKVVMVAATLAIALAVPNFQFFTAFVGSVFMTVIGFFFPIAMWFQVNRGELSKVKLLAAWNVLMLKVGLALMVIGAKSAFDILHHSSSGTATTAGLKPGHH